MSYELPKAWLAWLAAVGCALVCTTPLVAQQPGPSDSVRFQVRGPAERLEMTVNSSKIVDFEFDVPRMMVNNDALVRVVPISPRSIQLSAARAGVTQLNVWDTEGNVTSLDVLILGDVAELDLTLKSLFPEASLRLRPLNSSLFISGFVPRAEMVKSILDVSRDYFPNVINDMTVGGVHKVLLHVKVMEVSRTKLRSLGFDFEQLSGNFSIIQNVSITGDSPPTVIFNAGDFTGFVNALRQYDLAKLTAEPTLVTISGRPAVFNSGGEVPIPINQGLGNNSVQYREFGTRIDFVPIVLGNGLVRLEVRPHVTEIDPSLRDNITGTPGFRSRMVDTAVEMKAGQTLAIAGLIQSRVESTNRGLPILADIPYFGVPFRRVTHRTNDVELLIFVTPEFCEAMDAHEVPPCGPGELTTSPTDHELYGKGYLEVPKNCGPGGPGMSGPLYEPLPPGQPIPPKEAGVRAAPPAIKNYGSSQPASSRRSGTPARPVGTSSAPQHDYSSYYAGGANSKPSATAKPALIGPLGYDDLK
jgi:pilus assembly protein CpaC